MKNYKFRAWDNHNKKWLMGYEYPNLGGFSLTGESVLFGEWGDCFDEFVFEKNGKKVDDLIIMQWTGKKDKHGNHIYDGDWIRACAGYISYIKYDDEQCCFLSVYSHPEDGEELLLSDLGDDIEVVGNRYEQLQN